VALLQDSNLKAKGKYPGFPIKIGSPCSDFMVVFAQLLSSCGSQCLLHIVVHDCFPRVEALRMFHLQSVRFQLTNQTCVFTNARLTSGGKGGKST